MIKALTLSCAIAGGLLSHGLHAQDVLQESQRPDIGPFDDLVEDLNSGVLSLDEVRTFGLFIFSSPFTSSEGLGDGPFDEEEWQQDSAEFGHRPTLQGNGQFLRANGLDAQSCNECHTIVSNATVPPTLGLAGVGGAVQNAMIKPSVMDIGDSGDKRTSFQPDFEPELPMKPDGVADFNGRFANPPFLYGGGGVELLAKEMTVDLQKLLAAAKTKPAGEVIPLDTHGINFGQLVSLGNGEVNLSRVEGLGFEDETDRDAEEILVVRPFGRKGENFSMRDFDRGAMQFHFGIQPAEVVDPDGVGGIDEDKDGISEEVTVAEMTALHIFDVTNPPPVTEPRDQRADMGFRTFTAIGCADCHRPALTTYSNRLPLAHPEVPEDPSANVYYFVDLLKVGFEPAPSGGDVVPLFADLKRHDMGPRLAETFERGIGEIGQAEFTTARLWGVADTAPYLHDGRATTLFEAIELHGGEAQAARDAFINELSEAQKENLINFLKTLRTPARPNEELVSSN
jgi:hypothetical protein